ncbi:MAG: hypothetical protein QOK21_1568, partial [Solirubrobacteraceae bacterium]|nr:hypothetical protein [Solirubrobacteraceae bacterium]
ARDDQERLAFALDRTFDTAIAAGAFLTLLTFMGAPLAMSVLTGHADGPPVEVLRIQSLSLIVIFLNVSFASALIALRRNLGLIVANLVTLAFTLAVAVVLIPLHGALGGAIAAAAGEWSLLGSYAFVLHRARPDLRLRYGRVPRVALAAAISAAAAALIHVPHFPNLGAVMIVGVAFPLALIAVRGLPRELLDAVIGRDRAPARAGAR